MDFDMQMCWIDQESGKGISFGEMKSQQELCFTDLNAPCWYSIQGDDLSRVHKKLNEQ